MFPIVPPHAAAVVIAAMFVLVMLATRVIQPAWWKARVVRWAVFLSFTALASGVALWLYGRATHQWPHVTDGAGIAYVGIIALAPAAIVAPVSAIMDRLLARPSKKVVDAPSGKRVSRRGLLRGCVSALPLVASGASTSGFVSAKLRPRMPIVKMTFEDLHPDLEGFRILHLSDVHLGACVSLADLESALNTACEGSRPDLVVLTGDLADDTAQIPGALELMAKTAARYGALSSLGNHEYIHDIRHVRPLFEKSRVPLLVGSGRTLHVGRANLFVGGADDPFFIEGDVEKMIHPTIARSASHAPANADFRLLLCHRPEGHGPAAEHGFDLTLAGHTHGGQLGLFGRSLFQYLMPRTSWWGRYTKKRPNGRASQLYTTSGFGHWFPFRFGCPTELPLIVLEGARAPRIESRPV